MNNTSPLITIAVPAYNAEKYLRKCLDSLIKQTMREIEIIVVNDGSTDDTNKILREYAEKDERIEIICKENGGLASARQAALEISRGQFFCVCDADDWVEPTMYERLYKKAVETKADIVMCDYWSEYPDGRRVEHRYPYKVEERENLLDDVLNGKFPKAVWCKLICKSFLEKHSLTWEQGINQGEDFLMTLKMLQAGAIVNTTQGALYHYFRDNSGKSYTHNITMNSYNQSLSICHWAETNIDNVQYAKGLHHVWVNLAYTGLRVKSGMTGNYYKTTVLDRLPLKDFVKYKDFSVKAFLILIVKLLGFNSGRWIVRIAKLFSK